MFDLHKMDPLIVSFKQSQPEKLLSFVVFIMEICPKVKISVFRVFFGYFITTIRAERRDKLKCLKLQIYKTQ